MSRKFVPPKLDMGSGFATATSMRAKPKSQGTPSKATPKRINTASARRGGRTAQPLRDTIPLTLNNLAQFFDWRRNPNQAPTLYKIAAVIWLYLPVKK